LITRQLITRQLITRQLITRQLISSGSSGTVEGKDTV